MSGHGFIDPEAPLRRRVEALEAQVSALSEAARRPEHDSGDYYTFTKAELDAHDAKVAERIARAIEAAAVGMTMTTRVHHACAARIARGIGGQS